MVERAISMDGTVTGGHGVGLVKRDYLDKELGTPAVDLMRQVRAYGLFRIFRTCTFTDEIDKKTPLAPCAFSTATRLSA